MVLLRRSYEPRSNSIPFLSTTETENYVSENKYCDGDHRVQEALFARFSPLSNYGYKKNYFTACV